MISTQFHYNLNPQIRVPDVSGQHIWGTIPDSTPPLNDETAVGEAHHLRQVFIHQQYRLASGLQMAESCPDFLPDDRRETLSRFIQYEKPWIGHQRPANGEHLLLTTGESPGHLMSAFGKPWEQL